MRKQDSNTSGSWIARLGRRWWQYRLGLRPNQEGLRLLSEAQPDFVRACPLTQQTAAYLRLLDWSCVPKSQRHWFGHEPVSLASYIAAFLVKLDQGLPTVARLHRFLGQHPALVWGLGFPLVPDQSYFGFDPLAALPVHRHLSWALRTMPNEVLQRLLDSQVSWLKSHLPPAFGQTISLDTKHIIAWTKENNPKAYIEGKRFDKTGQASGDPDAKVGCKRQRNIQWTTPASEGKPASRVSRRIGDFYWGYASGVVVTKVEGWGEFILAELTQTFDKGDTTYFFPLMEQVERRLGCRPRYGALDAAFDAFYVYDYFHSPEHDGFAAVPFSEKGGKSIRTFDEQGLPLCEADLPMPLKFTYTDRTTAIIPYQRAKHVCPLLHPPLKSEPGQTCPIAHKNWAKGGCDTHLADTIGARLRYQLDRESEPYHAIYNQRTAVERVNSQAVDLGIERPKLRNQQAITNLNTLTYLLINLRAMQHVLTKLENENK